MLNAHPTRVLLTVLLALSACAAMERREQVDRARVELEGRPGARQAVAYAEQLHGAFRAGAYQGRAEEFKPRVEEGLAALTANEARAGSDAAILVAWRGLLLADLDRTGESWQELVRSMALRPTLLAARAVLPVWGQSGRTDQVGRVCAQTAAALSGDDLYVLVGLCKDQMNAVSEEAAMAWATPEVRAFYEQEQARRQADMDALAQAAAAQRLKEQQAARSMEICCSRCRERAFMCANQCGADSDCRQNCVGANSACVDACQSRAYRSLGR